MRGKRIAFLMTALLLFCCGCGKNSVEDSDFDRENQSERMVAGTVPTTGGGTFYYKAYMETGYFEIENHLMQYVAYGTGESYALCSRANCKHSGKDCAAWVEQPLNVAGLAAYQGQMYAFFKNTEENSYDLKTFTVDGEEQREIVSIPLGDRKEGGWCVSDMNQVYYCGNRAWCSMNYEYVENGVVVDYINQCVGYDLDTGESVELSEKQRNYCSVQNPFSYVYISPACIVLSDLSDDSVIFCFAEKRDRQLISQQTLQEMVKSCVPAAEEYPQIKVRCLGWIQESDRAYFQAFCYRDSETGGTDYADHNLVFSWDLKNDAQVLAEFDQGGLLFAMEGQISTQILEGNYILYAEDLPEERADIYRLDLMTGEKRRLFEDDTHITFRILYAREDAYVGTLDEGDRLCLISKEDYEKGDFSAAKKIKGLW